MREQYETDGMRDREQEVARILEKNWNFKLEHLPKSYYLDYVAIQDKKPIAWIEIKCRKIRHDQYPEGVVCSLSKWMHGIEYSKFLGVKFIFVAACEDGIYWTDGKANVTFGYGGRTVATRDSGDVEPVVYIPPSEFRKISE